jgi:hypothetical protein
MIDGTGSMNHPMMLIMRGSSVDLDLAAKATKHDLMLTATPKGLSFYKKLTFRYAV